MDTLIEQNKELNKEVGSGMITFVWQRQTLIPIHRGIDAKRAGAGTCLTPPFVM